jgi:hypothetical protein
MNGASSDTPQCNADRLKGQPHQVAHARADSAVRQQLQAPSLTNESSLKHHRAPPHPPTHPCARTSSVRRHQPSESSSAYRSWMAPAATPHSAIPIVSKASGTRLRTPGLTLLSGSSCSTTRSSSGSKTDVASSHRWLNSCDGRVCKLGGTVLQTAGEFGCTLCATVQASPGVHHA